MMTAVFPALCITVLKGQTMKLLDFAKITACGECCDGCGKKAGGFCEGCVGNMLYLKGMGKISDI